MILSYDKLQIILIYLDIGHVHNMSNEVVCKISKCIQVKQDHYLSFEF